MPPNNHTGPYVLEDCPHGCDQRAPSSLEGSEQAVEPLSPALQPLQKKKQQLQAKTLRGRSSKGSPKPALYFTAQTPTNRSHEAEFWNMSKTGLGERLWLEVRNMVQNGDPRPRFWPHSDIQNPCNQRGVLQNCRQRNTFWEALRVFNSTLYIKQQPNHLGV